MTRSFDAKLQNSNGAESLHAQSDQADGLNFVDISGLTNGSSGEKLAVPAATDKSMDAGTIRATDQNGTALAGSDVSAENQGLTADQILANAQKELSQHGLNAKTKQDFADAIKAADDQFTASDLATTQKLIGVLESGKQLDGKPLSPEDRVSFHNAVAGELNNAQSGYMARQAYFQILNQSKQYASAEVQLKDMIAVADKLPIKLAQREAQALKVDLGNPAVTTNIQRTSLDNLDSMHQLLAGTNGSTDDGMINTPISVRKLAASFYIQGYNGSNSVLKPVQAAQLVEDAKAKTRDLHGNDADANSDATLTGIARIITPLLPDHLKQQKLHEDQGMWGSAKTGFSAGAGFAAAALIAGLLTKHEVLGSTADGLSVASKGLVGIVGYSTTTAADFYLNQATGTPQSLRSSMFRAAAADGAVLSALGVRSYANNLLFARGATSDALAARAAGAAGVPAGELNANQMLHVAQRFEPAANQTIGQKVRSFVPTTRVDLANDSASSLGVRRFASGYTTAFTGLYVNQAVGGLDRGARAGKPPSWASIFDPKLPLEEAAGFAILPIMKGDVLLPGEERTFSLTNPLNLNAPADVAIKMIGTPGLFKGVYNQFLSPPSPTNKEIKAESGAIANQTIPPVNQPGILVQ